MEAHPPYLLPEGVHPLWTPPLASAGDNPWNLCGAAPLDSPRACDSGLRLDMARTIPLAPFLRGRGK